MPRLICGAVYKKLDEPMKVSDIESESFFNHPPVPAPSTHNPNSSPRQFLWTDKLALNTVHINDVIRALWHLALNGKSGEVYNLADKAESSRCMWCV